MLASRTRVAATAHYNYGLGLCPRRPFTTLGVSASRAAAKRAMSLRRRCASSRCLRSQREHASTSSFPRVARRRGSCTRRSARLARSRDPDRRVIDAARAIARRARLGRGRPDPFGYRLVFFTSQAIPDARFANLRRLERSLTRLFPALDPQAFSARSAVRSVKRDLTVRFRVTTRAPEPPSTSTRYVFATWCLSVSQEEPDGGLSGSFRAAAPRTRARRRSHARRIGGEPRVPASAPIRRGARITRASPRPPRVFTLARWTRSGGVSGLDTAQIGVGPPRAVRSGVTWR